MSTHNVCFHGEVILETNLSFSPLKLHTKDLCGIQRLAYTCLRNVSYLLTYKICYLLTHKICLSFTELVYNYKIKAALSRLV